MYTHAYNIHICVCVYIYIHVWECVSIHAWVLICTSVPKLAHSCCRHCSHRPHSISSHTDCPGAVGFFTLTRSFWKQIKKSFPTCGWIWASPLGCLPLLDIQDPRISPMNMARELSHAASVFKEKTDFGGLIHQPKIKDTKEGGHIVSHDSVAEPLSPWVICFNYCLQSVVSLCCFEGRVWVSVNLSLFPSTFLWLFPWVQNAYSLTWLQFFIFFFISSHFFLSLLLCNGSYKYLWEVS